MPKKTALYDFHKKLKANIVDFADFYLPVFYSSIQEEHQAVRNNIGVFDVSHMGNIIFDFRSKENAVSFFNYLFPNDFSRVTAGKCIYSPMLNHKGTVIDDLIVMSLSETRYHIIVNASNIEKDFKWMSDIVSGFNNITIKNESDKLSIISVQGPKSAVFLEKEFHYNVTNLKSFNLIKEKFNNSEIILSSTGYTGEEGFEIIIDNEQAMKLMDEIYNKGLKYNVMYCGLGSRDTLRLEAGLPLYGHELDEEHYPLQANISWSVKLKKDSDFIGKKELLKNKDSFKEILAGFEVAGKAIPRNNMNILDADNKMIGYVTSGSYSPTLQKNIG
ncbi:MAG: glycine cleavage system aminomethyltransferase GcvT, partial [Spirochaetes bacterium]|nr:glycine cleavage system aminomethyltransferase GcvT [Spirochaetota bacterium]